jgi:hypothetical protein
MSTCALVNVIIVITLAIEEFVYLLTSPSYLQPHSSIIYSSSPFTITRIIRIIRQLSPLRSSRRYQLYPRYLNSHPSGYSLSTDNTPLQQHHPIPAPTAHEPNAIITIPPAAFLLRCRQLRNVGAAMVEQPIDYPAALGGA